MDYAWSDDNINDLDCHAPQQEEAPSPIPSIRLKPQPMASSIISRSTQSTPLNHNNRPPPRRVDHTYRDYSGFPAEDFPEAARRAPTNFPSKLHKILSTHEYCHIISWMPHGRAWKIHDKEGLVKEVIPKYFLQTKYESFTRQLNGWGLKRLHQSGNDYNAYYHECLLRGLPHLTSLMKRAESNKGKLLPHVEGEPNFYEIARQLPPLPPTQKAEMMHYNCHEEQYNHYSPSPHIQEGVGHGRGLPQPGYYPSYPGGAQPLPPPTYHGHGPHFPSTDAAYMLNPPVGYPSCPPPYYPTHQYHESTSAHNGHPQHHVPHLTSPPPHNHPYCDGRHTYGPTLHPPHCGGSLQYDLNGLNHVENPPSRSILTDSPTTSKKVPSAPTPQGLTTALQGTA